MEAKKFSPIIESVDFEKALTRFKKENYDSVDGIIVLKKYGVKNYAYINESGDLVWNDDSPFNLTAEVLWPATWGVYKII